MRGCSFQRHAQLQALRCSETDICDAGLAWDAGALPQLRELQLDGTELAEVDTLRSLAAATPALRVMDISDTPVCEAADSPAALRALVTSLWPALHKLNGDLLQPLAPRQSLHAAMQPLGQAAFASEDSAAHEIQLGDSAPCSCLEGTACEVPDACKDWANRFTVAAAARAAACTSRPYL